MQNDDDNHLRFPAVIIFTVWSWVCFWFCSLRCALPADLLSCDYVQWHHCWPIAWCN